MIQLNDNPIRKYVKIVLMICCLIGGSMLYGVFALSKTETVCGRVVRESSMKGFKSYIIEFRYKGAIWKSGIDKIDVKNEISFDSLLKIGCIKVNVSVYDANHSFITDPNVIK